MAQRAMIVEYVRMCFGLDVFSIADRPLAELPLQQQV